MTQKDRPSGSDLSGSRAAALIQGAPSLRLRRSPPAQPLDISNHELPFRLNPHYGPVQGHVFGGAGRLYKAGWFSRSDNAGWPR
jgi:hypothetical protein